MEHFDLQALSIGSFVVVKLVAHKWHKPWSSLVEEGEQPDRSNGQTCS